MTRGNKNYTLTFPEKTGTIALTNDVITLGTDQSITGKKTFASNVNFDGGFYYNG